VYKAFRYTGPKGVKTNSQIILDVLAEYGVLLESDLQLPSVAGLIAGEPVRGSWWPHPRAQLIFTVLQQLADHRDVLITKLISGKVTFVHRRLWSDVIAIGQSGEPWQMQKLSAAAKRILGLVEQNGWMLSHDVDWPARFKSVKPGAAIRELERRLLIHSEEFHTESGAHAKQIETWEHWADRRNFRVRQILLETAKQNMETIVDSLNARFKTAASLPWTKIT
jgi:hypothetical protein